MKNWQNSFSARLRRTQWNMQHGRSTLNPGTTFNQGNGCQGNKSAPHSSDSHSSDGTSPAPASMPTGLAVAAAAEPVVSKLPAPGATPAAETFSQGNGCQGNGNPPPHSSDNHSTDKSPVAKLGLRYER